MKVIVQIATAAIATLALAQSAFAETKTCILYDEKGEEITRHYLNEHLASSLCKKKAESRGAAAYRVLP